MCKKLFLSFCLMGISLYVFTQVQISTQIDSVLVCNVKFKDSKFDNPHAGSGFIVNYKGKHYACTAKHVLFFAKTDSMKTISFNNALKSWVFHPKNNPNKKITAGRLVNENTKESLAMPPNGDWLIFEVESTIPKDVAIYTIRTTPLNEDETLYFFGYPYKHENPIRVKGSFIGFTKDKNLQLDVPKGVYNGCSGGPVLDQSGKLVGLVSMGYFNKKTQKMVFEPASIAYFKKILND